MKKFLSKFSRLGLTFVGIHATLVLLIPLWVKLFPPSCNIICIFYGELSYFLLFNIPGQFSAYLILPMLQVFKSHEVRLSGDLTMIDYIPIYLFSAIFYYFVGVLIQIVRSGTKYKLKVKKLNGRKK